MAQRRMFSPQIVDSDAFLEMSLGAQNLYFHFGMRADDDGFVGNPKRILKTVGGNDDDMKLLLVKRFILPFESGIIVLKHWRINNYIRKDRYKETSYTEEKNKLLVKTNGSYTFDDTQGLPIAMVPWKSDEDKHKLLGIPDGIPVVDAGKVRLGKENKTSADAQVSVVKDEPEVRPSKAKYPHKKEVFSLWGKYPRNWDINTSQCKAAENLYAERGIEKIKDALEFWVQHKDEQFCSDASSPFKLDANWSSLFRFGKRHE